MPPAPFTLVVADGRRSKYGIAAVLGAVETLAPELYPPVLWPTRERPLERLVADCAADGVHAVVLWSFYSTEFVTAQERLARVRAATPAGARVTHLVGGAHASAEPELTARAGWDLVAHGEGELTMVDVVRALHAGDDPRSVTGICHVDEQGTYHGSRGRMLDGLDDVPSFALREGRVGPIEITRGCIYACRFCQTPFLFKARFRHRGVDSVRQHVQHLLAAGMTDVRFLTPTCLSYGTQTQEPDLDAVEGLLRAVRAELPARGRLFFGSFPSELRPEHATVETLTLIKRLCDNDNVIIGGQSGSDDMLGRSRRGHTTDAVRAAVENARRVGIKANVDFLFGMPGETEADVEGTIALCRELAAMGARVHTHTFMPLPGTPWSHEPPGQIGPRLRLAVQQLESAGQAYGSWEEQQALAQELAAFDSFVNRRKAARVRAGRTADAR